MGLFGPSKAEQERDELRARAAYLEQQIVALGGGELLHVQGLVGQAQRQLAELHQQYEANRSHVSHLANEIARAEVNLTRLREEIGDVQQRLFRADLGYYDFSHPAEASVELGLELAKVRAEAKAMVSNRTATTATRFFTFNDSHAKGRKFTSDMSKLMLRSYNAEAENCILKVRAGSLDSAVKRLQRAKDQAERLGKMIDLEIASRYHWLRTRELFLASQHLQAKALAKEAEREERGRLREEKQAQKEFEKERAKLVKERGHYEKLAEALKLKGDMETLAEILAKLKQLDIDIKAVDYRVANIRAGYVYVVSNVGSFGDNIIKIGMTRRLDPMDRVRELGDASVPFRFDVHALFFSEDAVGVEAELHRRFADKRVNRVNLRREYFYATPAEVKEQLVDIAGTLLEFEETAEAEQYRESQRLRMCGHSAAPGD